MKELLAWLERNEDILQGHSLENKRALAIAAGHDIIAVNQWYMSQRFKQAI